MHASIRETRITLYLFFLFFFFIFFVSVINFRVDTFIVDLLCFITSSIRRRAAGAEMGMLRLQRVPCYTSFG